jgi:uncharacterized protein YkwD
MPTCPAQAIGFLLGFWLSLILLMPIGAAGVDGGDSSLQALEGELHRSINGIRRENHLIALRRDRTLDRVARAHSEDMASRGYLAHESPEGSNPVDRLTQGGVEGFTLAAENVGLTSRDDSNREILREWLASLAHRSNLLAPVFNTTGIGIHRAADNTLYYTQVYVTFPR